MVQVRGNARGVPASEVFQEHMRDPEFARAYEELGPEFDVISQLIDLRNQRKISQAKLAELVGTQQPSIARLESRQHIGDLTFLQRVASALGAELQVRLVPREALKRPTRTPPHRRNSRTART